MSKPSNVAALCLAVFLFSLANRAHGQTFAGTILGRVLDPTGAVVQGATVTVVATETRVARTVNSDEKGYFEVPLLPPAEYSITVDKTGFKKFTRGNLQLQIDSRMEVPISLSPGDVRETVEVKGDSPLLETTTSSLSHVIDSKHVQELPTSSRNFFQIAEITPGLLDIAAGAVPADSGSVGFGEWASNGGLPNTNEFMVDGATAVTSNLGASSIIPTIDAIAEMKVLTNAPPAEFGRSGGAVMNIVYKSGTNDLHGTVYEFWKNRVLNANTWVNNVNGVPTSFSNVNTFGYSVGGPVILPKIYNGRNKLFFFTNYEGYRDVLPGSALLTVPTALQKAGNFSQTFTTSGQLIQIYDPTTVALVPGTTSTYTRAPYPGNIIPPSQINPVANNLIQYYPNPNATASTVAGANNYLSEYSAKDTQNIFAIKIDYNVTDRQRFFARYTQSSQGGGAANYFGSTPGCSTCLVTDNPAGSVSPRGGGSNLYIHPKNGVLGYTFSITPTSLLDLRASVNYQFLNRLPQSSGFNLSSIGWPSSLVNDVYYVQFPPTTITGFQGLGTASNGDLLQRADFNQSVQGSLTLIRGSHTIKTGGDFRLYRYNDLQATNNTPAFSFTAAPTQMNPAVAAATSGNAMASFLTGNPASGTYTTPAALALQYYYAAGYVQDDWRVNSRLTLNIGFRYDIETPYTERYNRLSYFDPTVTSAATMKFPAAIGGLQFVTVATSSRARSDLYATRPGPRAGLAYKISDHTVFRSGFGLMYQQTMDVNAGGVTFGDDGYTATSTFTSSNNGGVTFLANFSNPFPNGFVQPTGNTLGANTLIGQSLTYMVLRNLQVPYTMQWNGGIEHQIRNWVFNVSYVGSSSVHQYISMPIDQLNPSYYSMGTGLNAQQANPFLGLATTGSFTASTLSKGQLLQPFPQFTSVGLLPSSQGQSNYNSLQTKAEQRLAHGLTLVASYTWAKNLGNNGVPYLYVTSVQNQYDLAAERSLSPINVAQRVVFGYTYLLPFGKGQLIGNSLPRAADLLIGGWQVSGITEIQTGLPLAITSSTNTIGFGTATQRPNNNGQSAVLPSGQRTQKEWFNTSDFSLPAPFTFGNVGPYSPDLRGPATNVWNTSLIKNTHLSERLNLQFRAEFYNLFNHPVWAAPGTSLGTSTFGVVAQKNGNRTGQLGLKLIF
jgi:Carboxypeptidase regulatory-like domain